MENFSDLDFVYELEIFMLFVNLLYKVNKHKKSIIDEFKKVRRLILEYRGKKANGVNKPL